MNLSKKTTNFIHLIFGLISVITLFFGVRIILLLSGAIPFSVPVSGTSMYPTLVDKQLVEVYSYNRFSQLFFKINRRDIVVFKNKNTDSSEYIKRVIGLPGDQVLIRNGFVYVNNTQIVEPYISNARSTFGHQFISDCSPITVPKDSLLVLGDNRKISQDSREIGYVKYDDVQQVLPFKKQKIFQNRWRNADNDFANILQPPLVPADYYQKLNEARKNYNLPSLKKNSQLEKAALARALSIISTPSLKDVSSNGSSFRNNIENSGYKNTVLHEISVIGFYDVDELVEYWKKYDSEKTIYNKYYQDTGITTIIGNVNGCETQVIVQEFGGYKPLVYSTESIDLIDKEIAILNADKLSWQRVKAVGYFYIQNKHQLDQLSSLIDSRITLLEGVSAKMKVSQNLTNADLQYSKPDDKMLQLESLSKLLNDKINRENTYQQILSLSRSSFPKKN